MGSRKFFCRKEAESIQKAVSRQKQGSGVIGLNHETMMFKVDKKATIRATGILLAVYEALKEKGYNPISQIVGYILSGILLTSPITRMPEASSEKL